jgi:uncharacterized protein YcfJ
MKRKTITAIIIALGGGGAMAATDFVDTAQVISATPVYERVSEPRQECYTETTAAPQKPQERSIAAPILGGVAGALLGRQVGQGHGRDAATAVGAAVGAMAGDYAANPDANRSYTGAAVGAVAGGLLGSQVGDGRGRGAATAAGTIAGAMIGDRVGTQQTASAGQPVQRCRTIQSTREVIKGYHVVYRYNGRDATTTLPYNPGSTVKVGVGVIDSGVAESGRDINRNSPPVSSSGAGMPASNANYNYRY